MAVSTVCVLRTLTLIFLLKVSVLTASLQGCKDQTYNEINYKLCTWSTSRGSAQANCESVNMSLAIIPTKTEFAYWQEFLRNGYNLNQVWVGAMFYGLKKGFYWDRNSGEVPDDFFEANIDKSAIADGSCVRFNIDQYLRHLDCGQLRSYLCQEVDLSPLTTESSLTTEQTTQELTTEALTTDSPTTEAISTDGETTELVPRADSTSGSLQDTTESTTDVTTSSHDTTETDTVTTEVSPFTSSANSSLTDCECSCAPVNIPTDKAELEEFVEKEVKKIEKELFVDKSKLSATIRKKTSAEDDRPSAKNVGYMGVVMLSLAGLIILAMDLTYVGRLIEEIITKIKSKKA